MKKREMRAEIKRLTYIVDDYRETYRRVLSEKCPTDEVHCECVPTLRAEIERLTKERDEACKQLEGILSGAHVITRHNIRAFGWLGDFVERCRKAQP